MEVKGRVLSFNLRNLFGKMRGMGHPNLPENRYMLHNSIIKKILEVTGHERTDPKVIGLSMDMRYCPPEGTLTIYLSENRKIGGSNYGAALKIVEKVAFYTGKVLPIDSVARIAEANCTTVEDLKYMLDLQKALEGGVMPTEILDQLHSALVKPEGILPKVNLEAFKPKIL
jgi:hypothetical protein